MNYWICWLFAPICWSLGGWHKTGRYFRRAGVPILLGIVTWPILHLWAILFMGGVFGSITKGYGDDPTDWPRWACALLYMLPLVIVAYFSGKWFIFGLQVVIAVAGGEWVNNWLNFKLKVASDRITEFLTCLCNYCILPLLL